MWYIVVIIIFHPEEFSSAPACADMAPSQARFNCFASLVPNWCVASSATKWRRRACQVWIKTLGWLVCVYIYIWPCEHWKYVILKDDQLYRRMINFQLFLFENPWFWHVLTHAQNEFLAHQLHPSRVGGILDVGVFLFMDNQFHTRTIEIVKYRQYSIDTQTNEITQIKRNQNPQKYIEVSPNSINTLPHRSESRVPPSGAARTFTTAAAALAPTTGTIWPRKMIGEIAGSTAGKAGFSGSGFKGFRVWVLGCTVLGCFRVLGFRVRCLGNLKTLALCRCLSTLKDNLPGNTQRLAENEGYGYNPRKFWEQDDELKSRSWTN